MKTQGFHAVYAHSDALILPQQRRADQPRPVAQLRLHDARPAILSAGDALPRHPLLDGQHGTIGCPRLNTDALLKLGLELNGEKQKLSGAVVFPEDYLNPRSSVTGELRKTENTHSIHWYSASWMPWHKRLRSAISKPVHFILGRAKGRGR